jgi:hypothetical protein
MSAAQKVLNRAAGLKQTAPGRWIARCPAHEDRSPSLSIRELETDGRLLLHCFSGCETGDVLAALGLSFADLFDKPLSPHLAPIRGRFDAFQLLTTAQHELLVAVLIAEDCASTGLLDQEQRDRLSLAARRLTSAVAAVGDERVPDEIKRIRRAESPPHERAELGLPLKRTGVT